jgi:antitoxin CptB
VSAADYGRLRWQCRRGRQELDVLLSGWLEQRYRQESSANQQLFREFLELPDPLLAAYLLGRERPADPARQALILKISQCHR